VGGGGVCVHFVSVRVMCMVMHVWTTPPPLAVAKQVNEAQKAEEERIAFVSAVGGGGVVVVA
jgi:hypothetical protein